MFRRMASRTRFVSRTIRQGTPGELPDPRLKKYLTGQRQTVDDMLPRARQDEPNITPRRAASTGWSRRTPRDLSAIWTAAPEPPRGKMENSGFIVKDAATARA